MHSTLEVPLNRQCEQHHHHRRRRRRRDAEWSHTVQCSRSACKSADPTRTLDVMLWRIQNPKLRWLTASKHKTRKQTETKTNNNKQQKQPGAGVPNHVFGRSTSSFELSGGFRPALKPPPPKAARPCVAVLAAHAAGRLRLGLQEL